MLALTLRPEPLGEHGPEGDRLVLGVMVCRCGIQPSLLGVVVTLGGAAGGGIAASGLAQALRMTVGSITKRERGAPIPCR